MPIPRVQSQVLKADPIPPSLVCIAGDVIHNLRSALDHIVCALVQANGNSVIKENEFPIFDDPIATAKLQARFALKVEGMRKEPQDAIRDIHPYRGGNDTLWRLHRLDVIDKHKMMLAGFGAISAANGCPLVPDYWI